jgi:glycosyltransferase involved in cell wall biosynthesis
MKAVVVGGPFPADEAHLLLLAQTVDMVLYGSSYRLSGVRYDPAPPRGVASREFTPRVLVPGMVKRGHLHWTYPQLSRALDQDEPDVVHVISEPWGLLPQQAASWVRRRARSALVIHGCDRIWWHGPSWERAARKLLARRALQASAGFAAESTRAIELARIVGLPPAAATSVIHTNARDPALFHPPEDRSVQRAARKSLGLPLDGIGFGFLGRLVPEKGPLLLRDAWRQIPGPVRTGGWLAFAGEGPLREALAAGALADMRLLGAIGYPDDVRRYLQAIDVLVHPVYKIPSWDEQGGRALVEGMMSGLFVIAANSGAVSETVGDAGVLVEEGDELSLAMTIQGVLKAGPPPALRARARARAISRYSTESVADQLLDLWERSLAVAQARG